MFVTVLKLLLLKDLKTTFRQKKHFITEIILLFVIVPGFIALNVLTSMALYKSDQHKNETETAVILPSMNSTEPSFLNFTTTTSEPWNETTLFYGNDTNTTDALPPSFTTSEPPKEETTTKPPKKPSTTKLPKKPTTTKPPKKPLTTKPPKKPTTKPPKKPTTTKHPKKPTTTKPPKKPSTTKPPKKTTVRKTTKTSYSYDDDFIRDILAAEQKRFGSKLEENKIEENITVSIQNSSIDYVEMLYWTCGHVLNITTEYDLKDFLPNITVKIANYDLAKPSFEYKIILHDRENLGWHNEPFMIPDLFGVPFPPINFSYSDSVAATWTQHCLDTAFYYKYSEDNKNNKVETPIKLRISLGPEPAQSDESFTHGALMILFEVLIPILISIPTLITGHELCEEKENNIHTFMVVMGLDRSLCILSHLIFAIIKMYIYVLPIGITVVVCFDDVGWYIFLLLFLYSHVYISYIFLILSLTKKTTVVIFVTSSLVVLGLLLGYIIPISIFDISIASTLSFFIPHMAFKFGLNHLTKVVVFHQEINLFAAPIYMPLWIPIFSLFFQAVFVLLLAFYFDAVIPIDDSPKKHPLFIFGMKYDNISESAKESEMESLLQESCRNSSRIFRNELFFEHDQNHMEAEIDVSHLSKKWSNDRFGIQDISFKAYQNQVTAILGHNGAGKSTTFSILAGFTKSSSGKVFVCGREPRNLCQTSAVGYCPQWDPLFPHLDVREHLKFYQSLKGENNPEEIEDMIERLGLSDFVYYRAKFLTGGMRRKLCVGMAMIGNSRVIILDEPMVGMEPLSRKQLIEIIRAAKTEHTILLATHYMDVADEVSDRIIILSNGKIVCNGSSNFLKANIETGFLLTVEFTKATGMESYQQFAEVVLSIVTKYCSKASIDGSANRQFTIFLPRGTQRSFPSIFSELEAQKEALQISYFDIRANTLEQVFIKVTDEVESNKQKNADVIIKDFVEKRDETYKSCKLFMSQIAGLLMRKHHYTRRHYIRSLIPHAAVLLFLVYFFVALYGPGKYWQKNESTAIENYPEMSVLLYTRDEENCYSNVQNRFSKNVNLILDDHKLIHLRAYEEMIYSNVPLTFSIILSEKNLVEIIYRAPFPNGAAVALNLLGNSLFDRKDVIKTTIDIEDPDTTKSASAGLMLCFFMIFPIAFMITIYLHVEENDQGIVHLYQRTQMKLFTYWFASFIFDFIYAMIPISIVTAVTLSVGDGMFLKLECWKVLLPGMLLIVLVFLLQSYVFSSFFTSSTLAVICFLLYNIIFSSIAFVVLYNLQNSDLLYVSMFFPVIAINMLVKSKDSKYNNSVYSFCTGDDENPPCLGTVYLIIYGNILFYLLVLLICIYRQRIMFSCKSTPADLTPYKENEDVLEERRNVESLGSNAFEIYTSDLRKSYSNLVAVRDITMGVQKGECFGLLGANGAGKSTFFNMLTAIIPPSCGLGFVGGVDIRKQPLFGFVPQKSRLIPELTVEETLYLFARLNGIKLKQEIIEIINQSFYFSKIKDTKVERISGGELRRLSIAIALITSSKILMLDEPTTGVDPRTRRHIWNLLISLRSNGGSSQLLTSHSMEECEALCTKIGFINHGVFIGIGTLQHLKNRFGNSHRLIITLNGPNEIFAQKLNAEIQAAFNATPISVIGNVPDLIWSFPKSKEALSQLYTRLIQFIDLQPKLTNDEALIKDFAIIGTSMEEVFATMVDTKIKYEFRF